MPRAPRLVAFTAVVASIALASSIANGAPPAPSPATSEPVSDEGRAETLFREGEKAFDAGRHVEACNAFERSLKLGPKLGTLLNLALCHETIGKSATAWREFQHASAWAAENGQKDRREFARQHLNALEPKLPRVVLALPLDRAFAELEIDGEPVPEQRWNLPIFLDPGEHAAAVSAPGKRRTTLTFRVVDAPTEQMVVVPSLPDDVPLAPPTPPSKERGTATARSIGIALIGTGGAALVAGLVTGVMALRTGDDARARGMSTVSFGCFAGGAALGAIGTYLLLDNPPDTPRRTSFVPTPVIDPVGRAGGLALTRAF